MAVMAPEMIDLVEAARRFGIARHTLNTWIREGIIPPELVVAKTRRRRYLLWDTTVLQSANLPTSGEGSGDD